MHFSKTNLHLTKFEPPPRSFCPVLTSPLQTQLKQNPHSPARPQFTPTHASMHECMLCISLCIYPVVVVAAAESHHRLLSFPYSRSIPPHLSSVGALPLLLSSVGLQPRGQSEKLSPVLRVRASVCVNCGRSPVWPVC